VMIPRGAFRPAKIIVVEELPLRAPLGASGIPGVGSNGWAGIP
jgi:hypothetical protein